MDAIGEAQRELPVLGHGIAGVSAILPTYNSLDFVQRAIDSVLGQQGHHLQELIVVDDCSTDGTADLVWHRYGADPRVKLCVNTVNLGPGLSRNRALRAARGEWIALIDADDAWLPCRLTRLLGAGAAEADLVFDNLIGYDQAKGCETGPLFDRLPREFSISELLDECRPGSSYDPGYLKPLVRREFLARHGLSFPNLRVNEDLVFFTELLVHRPRVATVDEGYYVYTTGVGQLSGALSPHSRITPDDLPTSRLLADLVRRHAHRLDQTEIEAIEARARRILRHAPISRFHEAFTRRRYLACLALMLRETAVFRHVLTKAWSRLWGRVKVRMGCSLAFNRRRH